MNVLPAAAVVAVLLGGAIASLVVGLRPHRPSMSEVRALLHAGDDRPLGAPRAVGGRASGSQDLTWAALSARLASGPIGARVRTRLGSGLLLIERGVVDVVSQLLVGTVLGTATVALLVASLIGLGVVAASPWWALLVTAVAPLAASVMWSDVTSRIERRRRELRRAVNDLVQLTSLGLTTDQSVEEALGFALSVGDSDMFELLRREIETAPARGIPLWDVLDALGELHGERELCELAASIERQGTQGVSITETVGTLATSMRAKALDELERDADRANANLSGPTVGFVVATIVFLAYPLAIRIGEAFGG